LPHIHTHTYTHTHTHSHTHASALIERLRIHVAGIIRGS